MEQDQPRYADRSRWVAITAALLFGSLGLHRFYLRHNKSGLACLLFFWTGIPFLVGIIDALRYLTTLEAEFGEVEESGLDVPALNPDEQTDEPDERKDEDGQQELPPPPKEPSSPSPSENNRSPGFPKDLEAISYSDLNPNEEVLEYVDAHVGEMMGSGDDKQINGTLILTNQRVLFRGSSFFTTRSEEIPLDRIRTVSKETGILFGSVKINNFKFTTQNKEDHKSFARELQKARRKAGQDAPALSDQEPTNEPDPVVQLERLSELNEKGVLSDEEFQSKKAELLKKV